jgi:hypothetical protein
MMGHWPSVHCPLVADFRFFKIHSEHQEQKREKQGASLSSSPLSNFFDLPLARVHGRQEDQRDA